MTHKNSDGGGLIGAGLRSFLDEKSPAALAIDDLRVALDAKGWQGVIFGGVLRDCLLDGSSANPRDVDVVVAAAEPINATDIITLLTTALQVRGRINPFEGVACTIRGIPFDIWPLHTTWGIKHLGIENAEFEDLLRTTFFNLEAGIASLDGAWSRNGGLVEALAEWTLEVNLSENPFPALCVVRSAVTRAKHGFNLGPKLREYLRSTPYDIDHLMRLQRRHYKSEIVPRSDFEAFRLL